MKECDFLEGRGSKDTLTPPTYFPGVKTHNLHRIYAPASMMMPDLRNTVTFPAYAATHCAYPRRDGQAELIWVASYAVRRLPIPVLTGLNVE